MKRFVFILGVMLVGIIALIESSDKHKRRVTYVPNKRMDDDVWFG